MFTVRRVGHDPVFAGLPNEFPVMENHCGQLAWPPAGWELIATAGPGAKTLTQCLRLERSCIYAAQFHIEMSGTPQSSRQIMANFLRLAKHWRDRPAAINPTADLRPSGSNPQFE
jgi:GMP synthase-like glutamine amidotransferase